MKPTLETTNLGNDESPCLIKMGLTLNEKERKYLQELLMKFQEEFAWSYKDMPGIDPQIAQHHIDTHDHKVPVKQKLRRMRIEWLLKIKEEVTKQLNIGKNSAKEPHQIENPQRRSRQKLGDKTMGMVKIPEGTSWAKITW